MLELRPNCECCDSDLAYDSPEAMICAFECTFCRQCVDDVLEGACPNCGGGFSPRPIRPVKLNGEYPPSQKPVLSSRPECVELRVVDADA